MSRADLLALTPASVAALANLRALIARHPERRIDVEVVDVLTDPLRGLADGVLVTPTLVKRSPLPERRVIGNLREVAAVAAGLGLGAAK